MFSSLEKRGGPYASTAAGLGGLPSNIPDTAICAVFMALYICFAAINMTILQKNNRRNHKFILSGMMFGFCMARITTLVLRIVWANRQHNVRVGIAANILVNAGILLVYIINLILAQRILRAKQPRIGWHPIPRTGGKVFYYLIPGALIMVITATVISMYTLNPTVQVRCRDVQLAAITYLLVFTCLPLLHVIPAVVLPRSKDEETFGEGSMNAKVLIISLSSCMCILISGFKAGTTWSPPRPVSNPAWYHGKAAFYVFNFVLEILILCLLTFSRIDKRFHIPNGSTKPGDYSGMERKESEEREIAAEPKDQA
ncbi:hypothetical protein ASPVEDRAFT_137118 [Aspergillus versicolor CBS 583.65]|uniref:G-protein coupled receptors family 3 profile domain-containing protein n=1 Tax=Aspergillus versicolor CBS 583.65 TaxID=1036611 RepID=A0A1L9PU71_ASPVE|nr:uncharacterized protein ASPVEDRAFT_137118 [Aspergillus versicolor CBS 583.65]OJJ05084.1 hypothetical protein ASPVEDRAFT_137118 [Aspergillus versicolor CBS 583.65]